MLCQGDTTVDTLRTIQLFWLWEPFVYVSIDDHSTDLLQMIMHLFYHIVLSSVLVYSRHIKLLWCRAPFDSTGLEDYLNLICLLMTIHMCWCPEPFDSFRTVWMFWCRGAFTGFGIVSRTIHLFWCQWIISCFGVQDLSTVLFSRTIHLFCHWKQFICLVLGSFNWRKKI